jgi:hypothetical protein
MNLSSNENQKFKKAKVRNQFANNDRNKSYNEEHLFKSLDFDYLQSEEREKIG